MAGRITRLLPESCSRHLAAHSPTERAALQTADVARRLMRGGELYQEAEEALRRRGWSPYRLRLEPEHHAWVAAVIGWKKAA